jgi:hypothetical protein
LLGSESLRPDFLALLRREDFRAGDDFFADDFRAIDLRAEAFLADDFRAEDFRADDFLALDFLADEPRLDERRRGADARFPADLRADDLRPPARRAPFFAPLEPPRDDFLAAAISSSDLGFQRHL